MPPTMRVSSPCARRWDDLAGDGATRFCSTCDRTVHDLDALSDARIEVLRRENPNGLCITYLHDGDGVFRRTPVRSAALAAAVVAAVVGCSSPADVQTPPAASAVQSGASDQSPSADGVTDEERKERLRALGGDI